VAHKAKRLVIDASNAADGLGRAGPVSGVGAGKIVGFRPNAEVGIVGDQGRRRRDLLRCGGTNAKAQAETGCEG